MEKPARFTRAFRDHEHLPGIPVHERTEEMRRIFSQQGTKLVLGQKHTTPKNSRPNSRSATSRPGTSSKNRRLDNSQGPPLGKGVSRPGSVHSRPPTSGLTFQDSIDISESMLSIGAIIDDFKNSLADERIVQDVSLDGDTNASRDIDDNNYPIVPVRKPLTPAPWDKPKLYCRYPSCKKEFKSAFDLFHHTRSFHTAERNFQQTITPSPTKTSGHRGPGGGDMSQVDPRRRPSPTRKNCSGILPDVPKTPIPSPDKYGVVWPVDVLRDQNKFQEAQELATFRAHSAKLREYNLLVVQNLKEKQWSLNKSKKMLSSGTTRPATAQ
jgi:hypothetical protein